MYWLVIAKGKILNTTFLCAWKISFKVISHVYQIASEYIPRTLSHSLPSSLTISFNFESLCYWKSYINHFKIMFATFLLHCFFSPKENACETRKNVFYFALKLLFVFVIMKFQLFKYSNVMTSSNAQAWNIKRILLNNWEGKHSLVMKFGQFI